VDGEQDPRVFDAAFEPFWLQIPGFPFQFENARDPADRNQTRENQEVGA
jgi:hypothetical protein